MIIEIIRRNLNLQCSPHKHNGFIKKFMSFLLMAFLLITNIVNGQHTEINYITAQKYFICNNEEIYSKFYETTFQKCIENKKLSNDDSKLINLKGIDSENVGGNISPATYIFEKTENNNIIVSEKSLTATLLNLFHDTNLDISKITKFLISSPVNLAKNLFSIIVHDSGSKLSQGPFKCLTIAHDIVKYIENNSLQNNSENKESCQAILDTFYGVRIFEKKCEWGLGGKIFNNTLEGHIFKVIFEILKNNPNDYKEVLNICEEFEIHKNYRLLAEELFDKKNQDDNRVLEMKQNFINKMSQIDNHENIYKSRLLYEMYSGEISLNGHVQYSSNIQDHKTEFQEIVENLIEEDQIQGLIGELNNNYNLDMSKNRNTKLPSLQEKIKIIQEVINKKNNNKKK